MLQLIKAGWSVLDPSVRRRIPWVLAGFLALALLETIGIATVFPVLLLLVDPTAVQDRPLFASVMAAGGFDSPDSLVRALVVLVMAALLTKNVASIALYRWQFRYLQAAAARFAVRSFDFYLRMPYLASLERDASRLIYTINALASVLYSSFVYQLLLLVTESLTIALLLVLLVLVNPAATLVAVGVLGACGLAIYLATSRRLERIGHANRLANEESVRLLHNTFGSFKELRVLGRGGRFLSRFADQWAILARNTATQMTYLSSTRYLIEIGMLMALSAFIMVTFLQSGLASSIGHLGLFGVATVRIMPSISRIFAALQTLMTTKSPIELLERERAEIHERDLEPEAAIHAPAPGDTRDSVTIDLHDVSFQYDSGTTREPAVGNVSLRIPFGESLGIAGASGAGKTTVADIVLGVLRPTGGQVLANGEDIFSDVVAWRRKVAYVPQSIAFVAGSVRENIAIGLSDEEIDDERLAQAVEAAQLGAVIARLPDGLESPAGEAGRLLSGGERQRIGIARAIYQNASVLVLDEATAALDVETEDRLTRVIRGLRGVCTTIIIAHRLKTIQQCDRIAFFESGRLMAVDGFDALIAREAGFRRMVELSRIRGVLDEPGPERSPADQAVHSA